MVKYAVSVSFGADPLKTEALEINQDADSEVHLAEQCPRGLNSAPIQNQASQLARRIAYYVGDVNRTKPASRIATWRFSLERRSPCDTRILAKCRVPTTPALVVLYLFSARATTQRHFAKVASVEGQTPICTNADITGRNVAVAEAQHKKTTIPSCAVVATQVSPNSAYDVVICVQTESPCGLQMPPAARRSRDVGGICNPWCQFRGIDGINQKVYNTALSDEHHASQI